jgi:proteasome lid subunit RPN8/RPN11
MGKIINTIKHWLAKFFRKLFNLERYFFSRIIIKKEVLEKITEFAKDAYPKEFIGFLSGKIEDKTLIVDDLIYQIYQASHNSAFTKMNLPMLNDVYGTVHSHPSGNNRPSRADLFFFRKHGVFHIIIGRPYNIGTMQAYDKNGSRIKIYAER